jgi:hypothetical protein
MRAARPPLPVRGSLRRRAARPPLPVRASGTPWPSRPSPPARGPSAPCRAWALRWAAAGARRCRARPRAPPRAPAARPPPRAPPRPPPRSPAHAPPPHLRGAAPRVSRARARPARRMHAGWPPSQAGRQVRPSACAPAQACGLTPCGPGRAQGRGAPLRVMRPLGDAGDAPALRAERGVRGTALPAAPPTAIGASRGDLTPMLPLRLKPASAGSAPGDTRSCGSATPPRPQAASAPLGRAGAGSADVASGRHAGAAGLPAARPSGAPIAPASASMGSAAACCTSAAAGATAAGASACPRGAEPPDTTGRDGSSRDPERAGGGARGCARSAWSAHSPAASPPARPSRWGASASAQGSSPPPPGSGGAIGAAGSPGTAASALAGLRWLWRSLRGACGDAEAARRAGASAPAPSSGPPACRRAPGSRAAHTHPRQSALGWQGGRRTARRRNAGRAALAVTLAARRCVLRPRRAPRRARRERRCAAAVGHVWAGRSVSAVSGQEPRGAPGAGAGARGAPSPRGASCDSGGGSRSATSSSGPPLLGSMVPERSLRLACSRTARVSGGAARTGGSPAPADPTRGDPPASASCRTGPACEHWRRGSGRILPCAGASTRGRAG